MTSKTIPPEDERVSDEDINRALSYYRGTPTRVWGSRMVSALTELRSRRSTQPDREAIIEECAKVADKQGHWERKGAYALMDDTNEDAAGREMAADIAAAIRSLKHSDTTSNGGKNG